MDDSINQLLHIENFRQLGGYSVFVKFNNGISGTIDFYPIFSQDHRKIFRDLLNPELFNTIHYDLFTLCWDNEADLAPEFLLEKCVPLP